MRITQITYRKTITPKPYHSETIEVVADLESSDAVRAAFNNLVALVTNKLNDIKNRYEYKRSNDSKPEDIY